MAQQAKKLTSVPKPATKATAKEATSKEKRALPPLSPEGQAQLAGLASRATELLKQLGLSPSIGQSQLHAFRRDLNDKFRAALKVRRGDPKARKQQRLEVRMAKLQAEIAALKQQNQ